MRGILDPPWRNGVAFDTQLTQTPAARKGLIQGREGYKIKDFVPVINVLAEQYAHCSGHVHLEDVELGATSGAV